MRVLATHIKHAMARKIERAALLALLYLCTGAPVIVRLRLPVHPVRNARRSIPPVSEPPQDHASLGLHVHPPLALVQTLPSRRGSRAPRDWALREVREGSPSAASRHVPCLDSHSHHHGGSDGPQARVTPLPCISRPLPILWILVLGRGMLRLPRSRRRGSRLVSFRSSAFALLFLSASGPATRPASPSIYGIDFSCYFSEMTGTRP
jgi:hypothetical protein